MTRFLAASLTAAILGQAMSQRVASAQTGGPSPTANTMPPSQCTSSAAGLRSTLSTVRVREGDTISVAVTGSKVPKATPTPTPTPTATVQSGAAGAAQQGPVLLVINSGIAELHAKTTSNGIIDIKLPPGLSGTLTIYASPPPPKSDGAKVVAATTASATPSPNPTPSPTPTPGPFFRGGGPTGQLTASIRDGYVASIPTQAPITTDGSSNEVAVNYTIKGEHSGRTTLRVVNGVECIAIGVMVSPPANRFTLTTGVAFSTVPHTTFTTATVTPAPTPAGTATPQPGPTPGNYVFATESSSAQSSVPFIGSFRLTDSPSGVNYYASLGFFTKSESGPLYGLSAAYREFLLTYGWHSQSVDALCPNVDSSGLVRIGGPGSLPAPIGGSFPTTCSSRVTKPFWSLTLPLSTFTDLLNKIK